MAYKSLDSIVQYCAEHGAAFDEAVLEDDMQERDVTREDSLSSMKSMWQAMKEAASSYDPSLKSASGLSGGQGALMSAYICLLYTSPVYQKYSFVPSRNVTLYPRQKAAGCIADVSS